MKTLISILLLFPTYSYASDRLNNEIVCHQVLAPGEVDSGLTLTLQSTATAWVKNVSITENGVLGPRTLANVQVPLYPNVRSGSGYIPEDILTYAGEDLVLELRVLRIESRPLNGGMATLSIQGSEGEQIELTCEYES